MREPTLERQLPTDPDIDLRADDRHGGTRHAGQRAELRRAPWALLAAISVGGACGSLARYGVARAFADPPRGFPWATFTVNVTGCLLIGVLMVLLTDVWAGRRLLRPFLGVGVLGGFTTFSTYAVDIQRLAAAGAAGTALAYLAATLVGALGAAYLGISLTRVLLERVRRSARGRAR